MKSVDWKRLAALLLSLTLVISFGGCGKAPDTPCSPLTVTLLKVGKADAIVVLSGTDALLIDTGEEEDGQEVVDFLRAHHIPQVNAMIITHFDRDHVGGADTVLEQIPVKTVYVPNYQGTHAEYRDFLCAAEQADVPVERLDSPVSFRLGDADVQIDPPTSYEIPDSAVDFDNNFSLITTIVHGEKRLVFMADAEKQRIRQWLDDAQPCDFLKVPHHGIYNGALNDLFAALHPDFSVICSSGKNPAEEKTLEVLARYCPNIYQTKDGDVTVISDGHRLEVHQNRKH